MTKSPRSEERKGEQADPAPSTAGRGNPTPTVPAAPQKTAAQEVGEELRRRRESAGLSQRGLHDKVKRLELEYKPRSHGRFSQLENGKGRAGDEVLEQYEAALGLEPGTLVKFRDEAEAAEEKRNSPAPDHEPPARLAGTITDGVEAASKATKRFARRKPIIFLIILLLIAGIITGAILLIHRAYPQLVPVPDSSDSSLSQCAVDPQTADSKDVRLPNGTLVGIIQLITSKNCQSGWARFVPEDVPAPDSGTTVLVGLRRDGKHAIDRSVQYAYFTGPFSSKTLKTDSTCVRAYATIQTRSGSSTVTTKCMQAPLSHRWWG